MRFAFAIALANALVLALGVVALTSAVDPFLGDDECLTDPGVNTGLGVAAQPFAYLDLLLVNWSGTSEEFRGSVRMAGSLPVEATDITGTVEIVVSLDGEASQRRVRLELTETGWSGTVLAGADGTDVVTDDVDISTSGPTISFTIDAPAVGGFGDDELAWQASVASPDAVSPTTVPPLTDSCETTWAVGDEDPGTDIDESERLPRDIVDRRNGELRVGEGGGREACRSLAAAWASIIHDNLDAIVTANDGTPARDILGTRPSLVAANALDPERALCPNLAEVADEHLVAAGFTSAFSLDFDDVTEFTCEQVEIVRDEIAAFRYEDGASYVHATRVAQAAERERNRQRCGRAANHVSMPGAAVTPARPFGTRVDIEELQTGDCFDVDRDDPDSDVFFGIRSQPCDVLHEFQVYNRFEIEGDATYGSSAMFNAIDEGCFDKALLERLFTDEQLLHIDAIPFTPTRGAWQFGQRDVTCVFGDLDGFLLLGDLVDGSPGSTST